jgi:predicted dinucleotide-utilizing enzyme
VTLSFIKSVIEPAESATIAPEIPHARRVWVYRYRHRTEPWTLAIATLASPGSDKLSLGGFRIAPDERTSLPNFRPEHEAIGLAVGMEEKVYWSRLVRVGGPLTKRDFGRIVGGKCVLEPTPEARVGCPRDFALLDFAIECLNDCATTAGIHVTTGQDLGHGVMSDGRTQSLQYLNAGYPGSVVADTSLPTAEGNYQVLRGMLRAFEIPMARATVGLIGVGHIGQRVLDGLCRDGARILAVEPRSIKRAEIAGRGVRVWSPEGKEDFLREPMDALVLNAAGGSLDHATVQRCTENARLVVVCGSENLVMPDPSDAELLERGHKVYCPTEFGGMMGYLTAVEEYLAQVAGARFDIETLITAAQQLEPICFETTRRVRERSFAISFEDAVREIYG